jgi:S-adenosylmethionine:tRNA ribosyltransferase-isomerase
MTGSSAPPTPLRFEVPRDLEAHEPPEARGLTRDGVRLMVAYRSGLRLVHATFRDLPDFLAQGDVLVVNTSGTLPASVDARRRSDATSLEVHLSTPLPTGSADFDLDGRGGPDPRTWIVEFRRTVDGDNRGFRGLAPGDRFDLPEGGRAEVLAPYPPDCGPDSTAPGESRLWMATIEVPSPLGPYLRRNGRPIRYGHVRDEWPVSAYQTVYAEEPGSAEMPSAGRAFTPEILTRLIARGVDVVPVTLHAGVSSLEDHEPPYAEFRRVSAEAARRVNVARGSGGRVGAVGPTAVRALESAADEHGTMRQAEGWTQLVVSPGRGVRVVRGLLTGWHEPQASHLWMLEAVAGRALLELSYRAAVERRYLWHEFGDLHLILP